MMYEDSILILFALIFAWKCIEWFDRLVPPTKHYVAHVAVQTEDDLESDDNDEDHAKNANYVLQDLHLSLTPPISPVRRRIIEYED